MSQPDHESVLITGAGSGIGLETSLLLAERGMRVYASVPEEAQLEELESAAGRRRVHLNTLLLDITDKQSIAAAVERVTAETGGLYGLVNSAGLGLRGFFEDLSEKEISQLFEVNVFGTMAITRAVLPQMREARRGRIVLLSSAGGRIATLSLAGYCAGKFALGGFGEALSLEMAPFGISVSLIEPGVVLTPHFTVHRGRAEAAVKRSSPYYAYFARHEKMVDDFLEKRRITPADVAEAVERALTDPRPRLHYVVGRWPRILVFLQRHLPEELFRRLYAAYVLRQVQGPDSSVPDLSGPVDLDLHKFSGADGELKDSG